MNKPSLSKLNSIKSPDDIDLHVINIAKNKIKLKANNKKYKFAIAGSLLTAYMIGFITIPLVEQYQYKRPIAPVIITSSLTFRGNEHKTPLQIDTSKLNEQQQRDLAIELLINDDYEQAQRVIFWMNSRSKNQ